MRFLQPLSGALFAAAALAAGPASATNICQAGKLTCATTMPVDGYCECTAHGTVQGGKVVPRHTPHPPVNASGAGCGTHPNAPGC